MKKTLTVNLAGSMFHIDDDAYTVLEQYLEARRREGGSALAQETERKAADLFKAKLLSKEVLSYQDVEEAVYQIGCPYGFNPKSPFNRYTPRNEEIKHLYRNRDNQMIGGVCSGLSEYFNLDPIIFRILFLAAFFGFGFGLLLYIILWIIVPPKTRF
jgi:phage shock protein PspC (stress-responsive transcriptional regulator)